MREEYEKRGTEEEFLCMENDTFPYQSHSWACSTITLGTKMLNPVFRFYCVKLFLRLYKISEVAFHQAQGDNLNGLECAEEPD